MIYGRTLHVLLTDERAIGCPFGEAVLAKETTALALSRGRPREQSGKRRFAESKRHEECSAIIALGGFVDSIHPAGNDRKRGYPCRKSGIGR